MDAWYTISMSASPSSPRFPDVSLPPELSVDHIDAYIAARARWHTRGKSAVKRTDGPSKGPLAAVPTPLFVRPSPPVPLAESGMPPMLLTESPPRTSFARHASLPGGAAA
jgi:hypothetical protein